MQAASVIHTLFHWIGMIAAAGMLLVMPWIWLNPRSHGQTMGGAIGVALAPIIVWGLLAVVVIVAMIVSCIAPHAMDIPAEVRKPCRLPIAASLAASGVFWAMYVLSSK
jgi:hypothetical protein